MIIVDAACCRIWPVALDHTIRTCGLCGEVPLIDFEGFYDGSEIQD